MTWQKILTVSATLILFTNSQPTGDQMTLSLKARKLPYDICGKSTINEYTNNGESSAQLGAYPWMAAIGFTPDSESWMAAIAFTQDSEGRFWYCGGSLVTDQFMVTAAHCLHPTIVEPAILKASVVRLGDLDLDDAVNDGASPVDIEMESTKFHPEFNETLFINDIGLIKLKTKVQFDTLKKPICLPSPEFYQKSFVDFTAVLIGWGYTSRGNRGRTTLSEASLEIKDTVTCRRNLTSVESKIVVDERVICASSPGQGSCEGDSGAPLMMYRKYKGKPKMFLLGLVSAGYFCAVDGYPGVYTRVSHFMDWITLVTYADN